VRLFWRNTNVLTYVSPYLHDWWATRCTIEALLYAYMAAI